MIACIFHKGSGLGNQLARYVAVRSLALDKGFEFGVINPENFKGASFLNIDMGVPVKDLEHEFNEEKVVNEVGHDIRPYDERIKGVEDFTLIDGEFQDEKYFIHHLDEIRGWLRTDLMSVPDDFCIVNFRGGEYVGVIDLFLPKSYWLEGMVKMRKINPNMEFKIVTDDIEEAKRFFQGLDMYVGHDLKEDWLAIRHAKYMILSNSSFAILPALMGDAEKIIAPKYWAGYNKGYWQLPQNDYKKFEYIHHEENI